MNEEDVKSAYKGLVQARDTLLLQYTERMRNGEDYGSKRTWRDIRKLDREIRKMMRAAENMEFWREDD